MLSLPDDRRYRTAVARVCDNNDIEEPVGRSHLAMKQSRPLRRSHNAAASALDRPVTRRA
jgi:hypothetical protein